eukprot:Tbor_TRINITY_DN6055_c1_g8::TRINITY_DN6055_c1_g8_i1::g.10582::m.10582
MISYGGISNIVFKLHKCNESAGTVDLRLKATLHTLRLITSLCYTNTARVEKINELVSVIIESRMMMNQWKYIETLRALYKYIITMGKGTDYNVWLLSVITLIIRSFEQVIGDFGLARIRWFHQWDEKRIGWFYQFFKSWTFLLSAVVEIIFMTNHFKKIRTISATESFKDGGEVVEDLMAIKQSKSKIMTHFLSLLKHISDMIIYFKWIKSYNPSVVLQSVCGIYSSYYSLYSIWIKVDNSSM